jgi:hypothetical protein
MKNVFIGSWLLITVLTGCAHRGAVRADCDGPLRPINESHPEDPVIVMPAPAEATPDTGKQP